MANPSFRNAKFIRPVLQAIRQGVKAGVRRVEEEEIIVFSSFPMLLYFSVFVT